MAQTVQVIEVLIALLAAAIGYGFGLLRDANRARTEREARYQDEVLTAASELLLKCQAAEQAAGSHRSLMPVYADLTAKAKTDPSMREKTDELLDLIVNSNRTLGASMTAAQPHRLKLAILAPALEEDVQRLMEAATSMHVSLPEEGPSDDEQRQAYNDATEVFTDKVRQFLQVPQRTRRT